MTRGGTNYFYHADALGSVTEVTTNGGFKVESYTYDVYGTPTMFSGSGSNRASSAIGNRLLFTGRDRDEATTLYNYRYRYYSPTLGRFLQPDPIGILGGINLYSYTGNNPATFVDPFGMLSWGNLIAGIGGVVAGVAIVAAVVATGGAAAPILAPIVVGAVVGGISGGLTGGWAGAIGGVVGGAAGGALTAIGLPTIGGAVGGGLSGLIGSALSDAPPSAVVLSTGFGAGLGALAGFYGDFFFDDGLVAAGAIGFAGGLASGGYSLLVDCGASFTPLPEPELP